MLRGVLMARPFGGPADPEMHRLRNTSESASTAEVPIGRRRRAAGIASAAVISPVGALGKPRPHSDLYAI
jgi:hypothetical protein